MNIFNCPIFKDSQNVICKNSDGYALTEGKTYKVLQYQAREYSLNFAWPAYVKFSDDDGKICLCQASRFKVIE